MAKLSYKKNINIGRVVSKVAGTILALYVGGLVITEFGNVMVNTSSAFYKGLSLIGWTIQDVTNSTAQKGCGFFGGASATAPNVNNCITSTSGAGVLSVIGLIGIASIVMEFVSFKL